MSSHGKAGKLFAVSSAEDGPLPHAELRKAGVWTVNAKWNAPQAHWHKLGGDPLVCSAAAKNIRSFEKPLRTITIAPGPVVCAALQGAGTMPALPCDNHSKLQICNALILQFRDAHGNAAPPPASPAPSVRCVLRFASPKDANSSSSSDDGAGGASTAKKLPKLFTQSITEARDTTVATFGADGRATLGPLRLEPGTGRGDADLEVVFAFSVVSQGALAAGVTLPSPLPVTFVDQAARTEQERAVREREQQIRIQREQEAAQKKNAEAALQAEHNATFEKIRKLEHDDARAWADVAEHARATAVTWDGYSQAGHFGAGSLHWNNGDEERVHSLVNQRIRKLAPLSYLQEIGDRSLMQAAGAAVNAITAANAVTADGPVASAWEAPVSFGEWEPAVRVMEAAINAVPQLQWRSGLREDQRRQLAEANRQTRQNNVLGTVSALLQVLPFGQNTNALVAILSKSQQSHLSKLVTTDKATAERFKRICTVWPLEYAQQKNRFDMPIPALQGEQVWHAMDLVTVDTSVEGARLVAQKIWPFLFGNILVAANEATALAYKDRCVKASRNSGHRIICLDGFDLASGGWYGADTQKLPTTLGNLNAHFGVQPADQYQASVALGKVKEEVKALRASVIEFCKGKTKNAGDRQRFIAEADARVATAREQGLVINDPRGASHDAKRARR